MGGGGSKLDEVEVGQIYDKFPAVYVGSVPVRVPGGAKAATAAVGRIRDLKLPRRKVQLMPSTKGVFVADVKTGDLLKSFQTHEISFVGCEEKKPAIFSLFNNDEQRRIITCHTFKLANGGDSTSLLTCIEETFRFKHGEVAVPQGSKQLKQHMRRRSSTLEARSRTTVTNKGRTIAIFEARMIGAVLMAKLTDDIAKRAFMQIREKLGRREPPIVKFTISELRIEAAVRENERSPYQTIQEVPTEDCLQIKMFNNDKILLYVAKTPKGFLCTGVIVPPRVPGKISLRRALHTALVDARKKAEARKGAPAGGAKEGEPSAGRVIALIAGSYLGQVQVGASRDGQEASGAALRLLKRAGKKDAIIIQTGTEGIRVFNNLTEELVDRFVLPDVVFHGAIASDKTKKSYALIVNNANLGMVLCHIFVLDARGVEELSKAMMETFIAFKKEQEANADPFRAVGERVRAPKDLFRRQIHRRHLKAIKPIGAGQFGQVYLATQIVPGKTGNTETVKRAVKTLRGQASDADRDEFVHEAEIMLKIKHRNLVNLIGVAVQQRPWLMVLEFLQYGDLQNVLKGCKAKGITLTPAEQLLFATQPASALAYLSSKGFLHMDIAARNCLVGQGNLVKISDFGMTRKLGPGQDSYVPPAGVKLPVKWVALECLEHRVFSWASDVWSYGIMLWEIMALGETPYPGVPNHQVLRRLRRGGRMDMPDTGIPELHQMALRCWDADADNRPRFGKIFRELRSQLNAQSPQMLQNMRDVAATLSAITSETKKTGKVSKPISAYEVILPYNPDEDELDDDFFEAISGEAESQGTETSISERSIGQRVCVTGFGVPGLLRYFGTVNGASNMCGIELFAPVGEHDGTDGEQVLFQSPPGHGISVEKSQVMICPPLNAGSVGKRVSVVGYDGFGILRFLGKHHQQGSDRAGVELDRPMGRNNGTVGGHEYFKCEDSHGVLCIPAKVTVLPEGYVFEESKTAEEPETDKWVFADGDAGADTNADELGDDDDLDFDLLEGRRTLGSLGQASSEIQEARMAAVSKLSDAEKSRIADEAQAQLEEQLKDAPPGVAQAMKAQQAEIAKVRSSSSLSPGVDSIAEGDEQSEQD
eukprot:m.298238 g.298238  ORF g.298238 m.298238 type:complete len:1104 (-) comp13814_c0_seq1:278-3589(-)